MIGLCACWGGVGLGGEREGWDRGLRVGEWQCQIVKLSMLMQRGGENEAGDVEWTIGLWMMDDGSMTCPHIWLGGGDADADVVFVFLSLYKYR